MKKKTRRKERRDKGKDKTLAMYIFYSQEQTKNKGNAQNLNENLKVEAENSLPSLPCFISFLLCFSWLGKHKKQELKLWE